MAKKIEDIEGVGPAYGAKLRAAGCRSVGHLLDMGCTKQGRKKIAEKTGLSESNILKWVNHADLFRVKGVASQYAELLECAGVDTVKELRNRNADNLAAAMADINKAKRLVRNVPSAKVVAGWVAQAKILAPMVKH